MSTSRRTTLVRHALALVAAATIIAACGSGGSSATKTPNPAAGGTVSVRLLGDWQTMDPQASSENQGDQLTLAAYDRLLAFGPGGKLIPYLAKSWKQTASSAVFTLRNDATCADGTRVTPTVVANSFKRLFNPSTHSGIVRRYFGNGPYSVTADDAAETVSFSFGTPYSGLVYGFAEPASGIVCPAGLANPAQLATKPDGSGPFTLVSTVHGDKVVFKARPDWKWGPNHATSKSPGFPGELDFDVIVNNTTAANLLTTGGLSVGLVNGSDIPRLQAMKSLILHTTHSYGTFTMLFNEAPGHITATDEAIRQAVMTAVDPNGWNQAANSGYGGVVSSSFVSVDTQCYDPQTAKLVPKTDTAKATSILEGDGYAMQDGKLIKDGKPLTLVLLGSPDLEGAGPEYIFTQLTKVGISVTFTNVDRATFVQNLQKGNFDVVPSGNSSPIPDPGYVSVNYSGPFPSQGGFNFAHIAEPQVDRAAKEVLQSTGAARCGHWADMQRLLLQRHNILPLAAPKYYWFGRGVDFTPFFQLLEPYSLARTAA